jgi:hemoglobin-like flavoprotein
MSNKKKTSNNHQNHAPLSGVLSSAFSEKQKASLLYTIRQIVDHTKRTILIENSDLSDEQILQMIEEDFFGE